MFDQPQQAPKARFIPSAGPRRPRAFALFIVIALSIGLASPGAFAQDEAPITLTYQGTLKNAAGAAIDEDRPMTFRLYTAAEGGEPVWTERHDSVAVVDGVFSVVLGERVAMAGAFDPSTSLFLGLSIDADEEITPRMVVGGAIRAQWAAVAAQALDVRGRHIHPAAVSIGETPVIDAQGQWVGDPSGLRGAAGPEGPVGPRGPEGVEGPQGPRGPAGDPGDRGPQGIEGPVGPRGPQGVEGPQGVRGPAGDEGPAGPRGAEGLQGPRGSAGLDGQDGAAGVSVVASRVVDGVLSLELSNGELIEAGAVTGPAGPVGPQGAPGEAGAPGEVDLAQDSDLDGTPDWLEVMVGTDPLTDAEVPVDFNQDGVPDILQGQDGQDGQDGAAGLDGQAGQNGQDGQDGVGITDVAVDAEGQLLLTTSAEQVINAGPVVGPTGLTSLIAMSDEPAGANCEAGGVQIRSGVDGNANGTLDEDEVDNTRYVCGAQGGGGPLTDIFNEEDSPANLPADIPKGSLLGIDAIIDLDYSGVITEVSVSVDVVHPEVSTLRLVLIAPDVDTYTLFDGPNGSGVGANLSTEFPAPTPAVSDLSGLVGEPVAGRYIIRAIDTDVTDRVGDRRLQNVTLKITRQADDAWRLPSNLVVDGTVQTPGLRAGDRRGGTALLPSSEAPPKHCTEVAEGETFYDMATHGLRVCDGQFWRAMSGVCGNGLVEGGEECDGDAPNGSRCNEACVVTSFTCDAPCAEDNAVGYLNVAETSLTAPGFRNDVGNVAAISGDLYLRGNPYLGANVGRVLVYRFDGETWQQTETITALDGAAGDYFGHSVALAHDSSGTAYVLVGAPNDDDGASNTGSAYLYRQGEAGFELVQKVTAQDRVASDYFGYNVALAAGEDGVMYGLIGARLVDAGATTNVGAAYVFTLQNGVFSQTQKLMASGGAASDQLGRSVALAYSQGTLYALAGAPYVDCGANSNCGAAYLFTQRGAGWTEQKLVAQDAAANDNFGASVAIAATEAGAVYSAIGTPNDNDSGTNSGSVYTYQLHGGALDFQRKILAPDGRDNDYFGLKVALGASGDTVLGVFAGYQFDYEGVSATGAAFVYSLVGVPRLIASLYGDAQGNTIGIQVATDGAQVLAGAYIGNSKVVRSSPECTADGLCVCRRGFTGSDCSQAIAP